MNRIQIFFLLALLGLSACQAVASPVVSTSTPSAVPMPSHTAPAQSSSGSTYSYPSGYANQPAATLAPAAVNSTPLTNQGSFESQFAFADRFVAHLVEVPLLPAGQSYQAWLIGEDGSTFSLGTFAPTAEGILAVEWTSRTGENLLARYARFQITVETAEGSARPTGKVVFAGGFDADRLALARRLWVVNSGDPATPLNTALMTGLLMQYQVAVQHIQNAENAAAIGALPEVALHMEHVINILEGSAGKRFKDYTGDGAAQNPGDGFGVKEYARQAAAQISGADVEQFEAAVSDLQDQCEQILALKDAKEAKTQLTNLLADAENLQAGALAEFYAQALATARFEIAPAS